MGYRDPKSTIISNAPAFQKLQDDIAGTFSKVSKSVIAKAQAEQARLEKNRLKNQKIDDAIAAGSIVTASNIARSTDKTNQVAMDAIYNSASSEKMLAYQRVVNDYSFSLEDRINAGKAIARNNAKPAKDKKNLAIGLEDYLRMQADALNGNFDNNYNADLRSAYSAIFGQQGFGQDLEEINGMFTGGYTVTARDDENGQTILMVKGPDDDRAFNSEYLNDDGFFEVNLAMMGKGETYSSPVDVNIQMGIDNASTEYFDKNGGFNVDAIKVYTGTGKDKTPVTKRVTRGNKRYEIFEIDPEKRQSFIDQATANNLAYSKTFFNSNQQVDVLETIGTYNRYIANELNLPPMQQTNILSEEQEQLFIEGYQKLWEQKNLKFVSGEIPVPNTAEKITPTEPNNVPYELDTVMQNLAINNSFFLTGREDTVAIDTFMNTLNNLEENSNLIRDTAIAQLFIKNKDKGEGKGIDTLEDALKEVYKRYGKSTIYRDTNNAYQPLENLGDPEERLKYILRTPVAISDKEGDKLMINLKENIRIAKLTGDAFADAMLKTNPYLKDLEGEKLSDELAKLKVQYRANYTKK